MAMAKKRIDRVRILKGLREIDEWNKKNEKVTAAPGETELKRKEKQLLRAREKYYIQAREFIELWQKVKGAQRKVK